MAGCAMIASGRLQDEAPTPPDRAAFWRGRGVFVTGGTGMIGSWLVRRLLELDARVAVLVKDADPQSELLRSGDVHRVTVLNGALEDFWTLERAVAIHEADTVFHLGAQTLVGVAHRFPMSTFEANIRGTYNLLEACRIHREVVERVVVASSDKAYGEVNELPYVESMPVNGRHPYEVSKSCTDLLAAAYAHTYQLPLTIARCGNVFGGGDLNWSRVVPGTIRSFLRNVRPVLRSDGTYRRDYIYVKDVVDAYLVLAEHLEDPGIAGEAYNFSDESPRTVLDIVGSIARLMDSPLEPDIRNTAVGEIHDQHLSSAKARSRLGWAARYDLDEALGETIQWYRGFENR
jgi:CDP-glucose 4,6-dehydratase